MAVIELKFKNIFRSNEKLTPHYSFCKLWTMFYLKRGEREHIVEFLLFLVLTSPNSTFLNPRFQNVKFLIQVIQRLYSINDTNTYTHSDLTENVTRSFESEIIYSQKANDRYKKPDISVFRKKSKPKL